VCLFIQNTELITTNWKQDPRQPQTTTTLQPFNGLFSRTTWVSRHQKAKPFWILLEQEITGWQWHQLDHKQINCTSLQTDNHASISPLSFYRPDALPANSVKALKPQTVSRPFFRDHPGELVPEKNCRTFWCKGRLTQTDTQTIRLGATPSGLTSAHLHHPLIFLQAGCPYCRPTNSVEALKPQNSTSITNVIMHCNSKPLNQ